MRLRGFDYAKKASEKSDFHKQRIGAAIMYGGKVLAIGYNCEKTHTTQYFYNHSTRDFEASQFANKLHAEMMALNKIQYLDIDFSRVSLYVYRESQGEMKLAKPCPACEARIREMGIKNVYYTDAGKYVHERFV